MKNFYKNESGKNLIKNFAVFIRENYLEDFARENNLLIKELDTPLMNFFNDLSEKEFLQMTLNSSYDFLTSFENETPLEGFYTSIKELEEKLSGISRYQITPIDIVMINSIQRQALFKLINNYTCEQEVINTITEEFENFYRLAQKSAFELHGVLNSLKEIKEKDFERTKLLTIFEYAPAAINITEGPNHIYRMANPLYLKLINRDDIIGKTCIQVLPELESQGYFELLDNVYKTGKPYFGNEMLAELNMYGNGTLSKKYFNFVYQPIFDKNNNVEGIGVFAFEVTDIVLSRKKAELLAQELTASEEQLKITNENLSEKLIMLEALNKEVESFSYSVSHDLRAPLRSIDGFSQALIEDYYEKLDEEGKEYLDLIRNASQKMGFLIDDILILSRLSRKEITLETINLSEMAHKVIEDLKMENPERVVSINIKPNMISFGDFNLINITLVNLLGNSWKYTGKNENPNIEFGSYFENEKQIFFVKDNGAGFNMAYSSKLFGAFQRFHTISQFPGNGIGLATVKRIIDKHNGQIWAESMVGKGALFSFTLN